MEPVKHLKVATTASNDKQGRSLVHSCSIIHSAEKWTLDTDCREQHSKEDRELCLISIRLPNGITLSGSIQDFQNIEAVMRNSRRCLMDFAEMPFTDKEDEADVLDCCKELDYVLGLFKR